MVHQGTFLDYGKNNAICIGQVDLFQPVMMFFLPIWILE